MAPTVEQVADLVKKISDPITYAKILRCKLKIGICKLFDQQYVSAQVKLGNSIAGKLGDGKRKDNLIKAGAAMSKLMGLMVTAVRDGGIPQNIIHFEYSFSFFCIF